MEVTRQYEWDAGHRVTVHGGQCKHVHGHRYRAEVTFMLPTTPDTGMVIDFGTLKEHLSQFIDGTLDHAYIAHPADEVGALLQDLGHRVYTMPHHLGQPTAENLAQLLAEVMDNRLDDYAGTVTRVVVYETPNCWATWTA